MQDQLQNDLERQRRERLGDTGGTTLFQEIAGTAADVGEFFGMLAAGPSGTYTPGPFVKSAREAERKATPETLRQAAAQLIKNPLYRQAAYDVVDIFTTDPDPQDPQPQQAPSTQMRPRMPSASKPRPKPPAPVPFPKVQKRELFSTGVDAMSPDMPQPDPFEKYGKTASFVRDSVGPGYSAGRRLADIDARLKDYVNTRPGVDVTRLRSPEEAMRLAQDFARDVTIGMPDIYRMKVAASAFDKLLPSGKDVLDAAADVEGKRLGLANTAISSLGQVGTQAIASEAGAANRSLMERRALLSDIISDENDLTGKLMDNQRMLDTTLMQQEGANYRTELTQTLNMARNVLQQSLGRSRGGGTNTIKPVLSSPQDFGRVVKAANDPSTRAAVEQQLFFNLQQAAATGAQLDPRDIQLADNLAFAKLSQMIGDNSKVEALMGELDATGLRTQSILRALGAELSPDGRYLRFKGGVGGIYSGVVDPIDLYAVGRESPMMQLYISSIVPVGTE